MQGHFGRCAGILELDLTDVEQELGQLEGALGQRLGLLQRGRLVLEQLKVMVAQHPGAGAGGHHHRPVVGEQLQLRAGDLARLVGIAGGVGRLTAAGLALRIVHGQSFALEQADGIQASLGIEQIHHAGTEQVDLARLGWILAWLGQRRRDAGGVRRGIVEEFAHRLGLRVGPVIRKQAFEKLLRWQYVVKAASERSFRKSKLPCEPSPFSLAAFASSCLPRLRFPIALSSAVSGMQPCPQRGHGLFLSFTPRPAGR